MNDLIIYGIVVHLFCDWMLQNDWMAREKMWLSRSWAGWLHGLIHFVGVLLVFPFWWALVIALLHIVIDTRVPLKWWRGFYRQTSLPKAVHDPLDEDDALKIAVASQVAIWGDQVAHITVIALVALAVTL
jgi:hypothetical protein